MDIMAHSGLTVVFWVKVRVTLECIDYTNTSLFGWLEEGDVNDLRELYDMEFDIIQFQGQDFM